VVIIDHVSGGVRQDHKMSKLVPHFPRDDVGSHLLAILCNPPLKDDQEATTSWRNVRLLADVLGFETLVIANVIEQPTRSSEDLRHLSGRIDLVALSFRVELSAKDAQMVVGAWGTCPPAGWRKSHWAQLLSAVTDGLTAAGHREVAHVGKSTRHPSRWRQHTSPIHNRYSGDTFESRLLDALAWSDLKELVIEPPPAKQAVIRSATLSDGTI
jgi:hypothetical protein